MLILSTFPGVDLLGMAFEHEGFCVVRGGDPIWGGDVHTCHPPVGRFDGVIGGPPCQAHSPMARINEERAEDLISEFERVVFEAQPTWFLMENVPEAPEPDVPGYIMSSAVVNNRHVPATPGHPIGPEQRRIRRFSFGTVEGFSLEIEQAAYENPRVEATITASATVWQPAHVGADGAYRKGRPRGVRSASYLRHAIQQQGLPTRLDLSHFTIDGAIRAIGNGVALPTGRALARAVKTALEGT